MLENTKSFTVVIYDDRTGEIVESETVTRAASTRKNQVEKYFHRKHAVFLVTHPEYYKVLAITERKAAYYLIRGSDGTLKVDIDYLATHSPTSPGNIPLKTCPTCGQKISKNSH